MKRLFCIALASAAALTATGVPSYAAGNHPEWHNGHKSANVQLTISGASFAKRQGLLGQSRVPPTTSTDQPPLPRKSPPPLLNPNGYRDALPQPHGRMHAATLTYKGPDFLFDS